MEKNLNYEKALSLVREGKYLEAKKYYEKAIKEDYDCARYDLGLMYFRGDGVKRDAKKAMKLWSECTWDYRGDYAVGLQYYKGEIVPRNLKKAYSHWNSAASHNCDEALINCAIMLLNGEGGEGNQIQRRKTAFNNIYIAAQMGSKKAKVILDNFNAISNDENFLNTYLHRLSGRK